MRRVPVAGNTCVVAVELDHLILLVNDTAESVGFYTDVLGFADEGMNPPFSVVRVVPNLTLQLAPWGAEGHTHLAFAMRRAECDAAFAGIRAANIAFGDSFHASDNGRGPGDEDGARGPGKAVYLMDPNRHLIELRYYDHE